jgi:hypothetical protein
MDYNAFKVILKEKNTILLEQIDANSGIKVHKQRISQYWK